MADLIKVTAKVKSDGYGYGFGFRSHYGGHFYTSKVKKGFGRNFVANFGMKPTRSYHSSQNYNNRQNLASGATGDAYTLKSPP